MAISIKLEDVIEGIESQNDFSTSYLNRETGLIYHISDEEFEHAESEEEWEDLPEWEAENVEIAREILDSDIYIALPDPFEVDEFVFMEQFTNSVKDEHIQEELISSLQGQGAFKKFKDVVYEHRLEEKWFSFRDESMKGVARSWCEENDITYTE